MTTTEIANGGLANDLIERIGLAVGGNARVSAVFGEPIEREGVTVIPVAKARFGFGGGGGSSAGANEGSGGGGGGGGSVNPVGYIEVRNGTVRFKRIPNPSDLLALVAATSLAALAVKRVLTG